MRLKVGNGVGNDFAHEKRTWIFYIQVLAFIMVRSARFELTAFGSGGQRSIQLSYERIRTFLICFVLAAVKASARAAFPVCASLGASAGLVVAVCGRLARAGTGRGGFAHRRNVG